MAVKKNLKVAACDRKVVYINPGQETLKRYSEGIRVCLENRKEVSYDINERK